jgi:predicted nuclease with TOPRIM domain
MSSERETVLRDIEDNNAELREVKEELKETNDPVEKADLKKRRDCLEETIGTLEKRALLFPNFTFPHRRALVRHAYSAYELALKSRAAHASAVSSMPSEEEWEALFQYCKVSSSPGCSGAAY